MADEMYLQICTQFHGGEYIGSDVEGNLYKGVVALMIQGLKKSISFVIKALPETKITGEWLAQHISECIFMPFQSWLQCPVLLLQITIPQM